MGTFRKFNNTVKHQLDLIYLVAKIASFALNPAGIREKEMEGTGGHLHFN
jgi:hypothetical protein